MKDNLSVFLIMLLIFYSIFIIVFNIYYGIQNTIKLNSIRETLQEQNFYTN